MVFDVGRLCVKTAGRDSGGFCVIVDILDKNHVLVTGPKLLTGVRRRKCNLEHLHPLQLTVKLDKGASDKDVLEAFKRNNIYKTLGLEPLTAYKLKQLDVQKTEKAKKKVELAKKQEAAKQSLEKVASKKEKPKATAAKKEAPKEEKPLAEKKSLEMTEKEKKEFEKIKNKSPSKKSAVKKTAKKK